jgi:threonine aldolase
MAKLLSEEIKSIPSVTLVQPVEANGVFVKLPEKMISKLQEKYFFYVWNQGLSEVRWMTSFDTTEADVKSFARSIRDLAGGD